MSHVIGIDLGTTNSLVAFMEGGRPRIIPSASGARYTPSVVGLDRQDRLHVGHTAKNQLVAMPDRTIAEVKRLMGSGEKVTLGGRSYSPVEISGLILRSLKQDAERFLGESVTEAVVTVPAYFTDAQRQATKDAGDLAGLKVERILNEPTAAALAYGIDNLDKEHFVLVYDLGGGTFDVSVLEMFNGVLDVKASAGNNRLGGGDFDRAVAAWLREKFERAHGVDLRGDAQALARIRAAAEQAKIDLSAAESIFVSLPFLAVKDGSPRSLEIELTRAELERIIGPLVRSTLAPMESALADARVDKRNVAEIVLVGGSSRVPMVRALVADYFGKEPLRGVDPDEAIALGAAVQAGLKTGAISSQTGIMITDVCPFTLGVEVSASAGSQLVDGMFSPIIPRNSTIPISRTETYATTADNQRRVEIRVFQGEARLTKNNVFLAQYGLDGVPPGPAGREKVAVTFSYDVNGILKVTTKLVSTGKEASITVDKSPTRLSNDEREAAKARLDREWTGQDGGGGGLGAKPGIEASASAPVQAAGTSAGAAASGVAPIVAAARARIGSADAATGARLGDLATRLEEAAARGDAKAVAKLDAELTDLLFELS
ncbi:MAG: Hsp70 family protein [Minicystis sp.]